MTKLGNNFRTRRHSKGLSQRAAARQLGCTYVRRDPTTKPPVLFLRRQLPARTQTVEIRQFRRDWMAMSQTYRAIRAKSRSPMDTCFWCRHKFEDSEMMGLALMEKGPNKVLCGNCADELLTNSRKRWA